MTDGAAWWNDRRVLIAASLAMAIPLVWPTIPPLVDLPGHMGRYVIQLDGGASPLLREWFGFKWALIGNLGVDLLVEAFAPLFGIEPVVKAIAIAVPVLTAGGLLWIAREVHGQVPPTAFLALPLAYAHPFHFGFINFALSMALALVAFALWLRLARKGHFRLRALLFVPIGLLLWVCHTFGWAALGAMAFSAEAVRQHDKLGGWFKPFVNAAFQCLPLFPPVLLMIAWRTGGVSGETGDWFNWGAKALWLEMILRDRWQWFDIASLVVLIGALLYANRSSRLEFSRNLGATALLLAAVFILLPRIVFGSAYADMRLAPFMLAIALIAIRPKPGVSAAALAPLALIALAFVTVRTGATTASFALHHLRHTQALAALDALPRNARLVSFVGRDCGLPWHTNRMEHLPALALVRRGAYTNDQWNMAGAQLMTPRYAAAGRFMHDPSQLISRTRCPSEIWRPANVALASFPRVAFDYVWMIDPPEGTRIPTDLVTVWSNGKDALYRIERADGLNRATP
jgi:hypothetical protein